MEVETDVEVAGQALSRCTVPVSGIPHGSLCEPEKGDDCVIKILSPFL